MWASSPHMAVGRIEQSAAFVPNYIGIHRIVYKMIKMILRRYGAVYFYFTRCLSGEGRDILRLPLNCLTG